MAMINYATAAALKMNAVVKEIFVMVPSAVMMESAMDKYVKQGKAVSLVEKRGNPAALGKLAVRMPHAVGKGYVRIAAVWMNQCVRIINAIIGVKG